MAEWKQKHQHMRHYNTTAHIYNTRYAEEQNLKIDTAIKSMELKKQGSILDVGCGTGLLLPKLRATAKNIVCLDISKKMLTHMEQSAKHTANVHLILADADYTPFRHNSFDIIFSITLLQNMPRPHKTLQEVKRIIRLDGAIIVTGLKKQFTQTQFQQLLKKASLETKLLETNDKLKCHIALCKVATKMS